MIIFNLDGTLSDFEHRRHFVENPYKDYPRANVWESDWKSFYEACDKDTLILPVADMWNNYEVEISIGRYDMMIWSGRCESVREKTIEWLNLNLFGLGKEWWNSILKMRPIGDNTPDDELKERWLDEELSKGNKIESVFDSDQKSIEMFRRRGIFVFDCNQSGRNF